MVVAVLAGMDSARAMMPVTGLAALFALLLPYTPLAELISLAPLPFGTLLILLGIVALNFLCAELTKHRFYRRCDNPEPGHSLSSTA